MFAYSVKKPFEWNGRKLNRGDVLRGDSARELEQPENAFFHARTTRVHDSAFAHHDAPEASGDVKPAPSAPSVAAAAAAFASSDAATAADTKGA